MMKTTLQISQPKQFTADPRELTYRNKLRSLKPHAKYLLFLLFLLMKQWLDF